MVYTGNNDSYNSDKGESLAFYCELFRGEADYGYDWVTWPIHYGFRPYAFVRPQGLIRCFSLTLASGDEKKAVKAMGLLGEIDQRCCGKKIT